MGYLIRQFENSADAAVMAVAAASMHGAIDQYSQRTRIKQLGSLLQNLRATHGMRNELTRRKLLAEEEKKGL